ncbi:DUF6920 family protein [Gelatiniphilus marinus]|uniref:DUF6920 family protein n=1 Tax=Gelatiniphilus marinus TaxID=1759464 RepID=A0ABW5JM32_9FLAO
MKLGFGLLLILHGTMHLIGFVKAFYFNAENKQALGISKSAGLLWLLVFILFIALASLFFYDKKWFYLAFVTVCISQILILTVWNDAKFGTLINAIIILVSISAYGNHHFNNKVTKEKTALYKNITINNTKVVGKNDLLPLPEIVQKWMENSGVLDKQNTVSLRLKQIGQMRTKPHSKWMPFSAEQYFNLSNPAFVWVTKVRFLPIINMVGRDKLTNGKGEMLIKLASLIPVVNERDNHKINSGTMQRFLSEMCWFPSAALNHYITWEFIDSSSAKATLTIKKHSVSGIFKFNTKGDLLAFETNRYYGGSKDAKQEKWVVKIIDYKNFDGYRIPYKCKVVWQLQDGDFNWLNLEITDLEYNITEPY